MQYDVFISHASEDKNLFVRKLATHLIEHRIEVWYDEFSLKAGSSLRRSIDHGLSKSRFGVVVLSPNFFKKKWTNWELDGLVARQNSYENELIIPIWLNVDKEAILEYSPSLADKVAIQASIGLKKVASKIMAIINPEGSTLVIARDIIIKSGYDPPVITDDWWLDVVEYSGKEWGHMEYLSFSIPWKGFEPKFRGEYIAKHALQKMWQDESDELWLSQLSSPSTVLDFINSQPGLKDACQQNPDEVALYFPQLTIKGFGDFMEEKFDKMLKKGSRNSEHPCEEEIALRDPNLGNYEPGSLACYYFTGSGGGIGPSTRRYDMIDCIIWLLSSKSKWLPPKIRSTLLQGMKEWNVWGWTLGGNISGFEKNQFTGKFEHEIYEIQNSQPVNLSTHARNDIKTRFQHSINILQIEESLDFFVEKFLKYGFIEEKIKSHQEIRNRKK